MLASFRYRLFPSLPFSPPPVNLPPGVPPFFPSLLFFFIFQPYLCRPPCLPSPLYSFFLPNILSSCLSLFFLSFLFKLSKTVDTKMPAFLIVRFLPLILPACFASCHISFLPSLKERPHADAGAGPWSGAHTVGGGAPWRCQRPGKPRSSLWLGTHHLAKLASPRSPMNPLLRLTRAGLQGPGKSGNISPMVEACTCPASHPHR